MHTRSGQEAAYRYGAVLALSIVAVVFFIVAPERPLSRAIGLLLMTSMLLTVVATGRGGVVIRRMVAGGAALVAIGVALAIALHGLAAWIGSAVGVVLIGGTLVELVIGLARMLRTQGVTIRAVSGALAVYLLFGLLIALLVNVGARVDSGTFFAQGTDGTQSQHVYFAFTTMTTTGYGDLTPATAYGRALSVIAMLVGQIYLVTVIAMLVGNLRRRRTD
ncbi:potassium channel family protein [Conexibacter stalactiti]|uniref:Potassium channel family protein n=1 Tax=Conexibacter stalactiti TaxID=1940611 RepID=A0ABU4HXK7_9ACTN|nr:potassium channel family protein [Conexibacter stalactiti]MDW5598062.1 potassium channel family protein [Conexibacter stalactiti]MEC5038704.1 potassium channel family protein [Conexibacter stalactiti]